MNDRRDPLAYPGAHMYLIYPGMGAGEEVEIQGDSDKPGYVFVRPLGSDDPIEVHVNRLYDSPWGTSTTPGTTRT